MITCPWCGTNYTTFQPNCQNCGGPMSKPSGEAASEAEGSMLYPPPAPRPIASRYAWKLLVTDGWAIASFVFILLGVIFSLVGAPLALVVATAFVGIPFVGLGLLLLVAGVILAVWRYRETQNMMDVLRIGEAVEGQIVEVEENLHVRVNMRHPWLIRYQFLVNGQTVEGQVSTFNPPGATLQPGRKAYVLYLPKAPRRNVLYPHP